MEVCGYTTYFHITHQNYIILVLSTSIYYEIQIRHPDCIIPERRDLDGLTRLSCRLDGLTRLSSSQELMGRLIFDHQAAFSAACAARRGCLASPEEEEEEKEEEELGGGGGGARRRSCL